MARTAIYKVWIEIPEMPDSVDDYEGYAKAWDEWADPVRDILKAIPGYVDYEFVDSYE